jgi:hypothetical protein
VRKIGEISAEKMRVKEELDRIVTNDRRDINLVRQKVREKILINPEVELNTKLEKLLKEEYELEREENQIDFQSQLIEEGKKSNTPEFKRALEELMIQSDIKSLGFTEQEINNYHKVIQVKVILGDEIPQTDILGTLLSKQIILEREKLRSDIEKALSKNFDKNSPGFQNTLNARMIMEDRAILDGDDFKQRENEFQEKKRNNEEIDLTNGYYRFLQKEQELYDRMAEAKLKRDAEALNNAQNEPEVVEEEPEVVAEDPNAVVNEAAEPKPSGNRFTRFFSNLFKRKPKQEPVVAEPENIVVEEENKKENLTSETTVKDKELDEEAIKQQRLERERKKHEEEQKRLEEEKIKEEKKKREIEASENYRAEFAGKGLSPEIKNCTDPEKLGLYLKDEELVKDPVIRKHLEGRFRSHSTVQSLEGSRAIRQKNRPPAIKYKDGTILLRNKKKDVTKQTSLNGCWSAVLSDMLAHFGAEISQEQIRAYRPEVQEGHKKDTEALMNRLNSDARNEINDMADLIQRTIPNVAHHHMTLGANVDKNKAVLREKVTDALLNKNSPVALLYGNHYVSVVGIKGNTLIVQNPDPIYENKYQKLSINDLFEGCKDEKGEGSVVIDWLEDLTFKKDGTCKNINEQWKNMGIECNKREFKAGTDKNEFSHVRGNQYYDTSRIEDLIEETIYLPKMSFGKEKEIEKEKIKQEHQKMKEKGLTIDSTIQKQNENVNLDLTENEITDDELTINDLGRNSL